MSFAALHLMLFASEVMEMMKLACSGGQWFAKFLAKNFTLKDLNNLPAVKKGNPGGDRQIGLGTSLDGETILQTCFLIRIDAIIFNR